MSHEDAPISEIPTSVLIDRMAVGWRRLHGGLALEFVQRWETLFATSAEVKDVGENTLNFVTDLGGICLRGTHRTLCLMFGGGRDVALTLRDAWHRISSRHGVPLILCFSDPAFEIARATIPIGRCLLISIVQLKRLMRAEDPYDLIKRLLWRQIPKRRLNPYNQLVPAEGSIFFGRENELDRLAEQDDVSLAIAGPGRIGKTSLVNHYRQRLIRRRDPRVVSRFYVSFYDCEAANSDEIARFFAMKIDPSSRSSRMKANQLVNFLRFQSQKLGAPLDLLLDEVDLVCNSDAFKFLGIAARDGHCRLVLCGKGQLLKAILSPKSPLECRVELIQLEPLDEEAALKLLMNPLADLGFRVLEPEQFAGRILNLTGRYPLLMQFCGQKLVEYAIEGRSGSLSSEHIDRIKGDFVAAQYFMKPLNDLEDPVTRRMGISLLNEGTREFTFAAAQQVAARAGLDLTPSRVLELCNDLVINNVLAWNGGSFRIASEGLYFYARKMGYLGVEASGAL